VIDSWGVRLPCLQQRKPQPARPTRRTWFSFFGGEVLYRQLRIIRGSGSIAWKWQGFAHICLVLLQYLMGGIDNSVTSQAHVVHTLLTGGYCITMSKWSIHSHCEQITTRFLGGRQRPQNGLQAIHMRLSSNRFALCSDAAFMVTAHE